MVSLGDITIEPQKLSQLSEEELGFGTTRFPSKLPRLPKGVVVIAVGDHARGREVFVCTGLTDVQTIYQRYINRELYSVSFQRVNLEALPLSIET